MGARPSDQTNVLGIHSPAEGCVEKALAQPLQEEEIWGKLPHFTSESLQRLETLTLKPTPLPHAHPPKHFQNSRPSLHRRLPVPGNLTHPANASPIIHCNLANPQPLLRGLDLHLKVPPIRQLAHPHRLQRLTANRPERPHIGVMHSLKYAQKSPHQSPREDLAWQHRPRLAIPVDTRSNHEVCLTRRNRPY